MYLYTSQHPDPLHSPPQGTDGRRGSSGTATRRSLMVAATGGHLAQLVQLSRRMPLLGRPLWVTFDNPQSRSLLEGEEVVFVRPVPPRGAAPILLNMRAAARIFRDFDVAQVISTGSGVALSFLPMARSLGIPTHYVESSARGDGPSLTGRLLSRVPGMRLYTQNPSWADDRWAYNGSIFDGFEPLTGPPATGRLRVVVVLGMMDFRFDSLVVALRDAMPDDWDVTWQVGHNDYGPLPGRVLAHAPASMLREACDAADLVVAHAGVGSLLMSLEAGRHPVVVAREAARNEHIDGHQRSIARELDRRSLVTHLATSDVTELALRAAAGHGTRRQASVPRFDLRA